MSVSKFRFLNIDIDNWTFNEFLENLSEGVVVTPNVDHLIKLQKDREFYDCYRAAEHTVCDSRILIILAKILYPRNPIKAQIAGSDLFPAFCALHAKRENGVKVFLLGGTEESVKVAQSNINHRVGKDIIVDAYSPPFGFERDEQETQRIIEQITASGATVLAVGVGAPKQEKWIHTHRSQLPTIKLFFAIGATIEFEAGGLKRAPKWMTKIGVEWLYRMFQEPGRLVRRYLLEDIPILFLVLKQRFGFYKNPWS